MRLVYVNLHTNTFFLRNSEFLFWGRRAIDKHRFILDWLMKNNIEIVDFVTLNGSTIPGEKIRKIARKSSLRELEAREVFKRNNINPEKIIITSDYNELRDDDVIVLYGHYSAINLDFDAKAKGIKVADHIHFYGDKATADFFRAQDIHYYISEIDLFKYCGLFQKNYSWFNGKYIQRKFAFQNRFKSIQPFTNRKNKAVAMGTLTYCNEIDFTEFFGHNVYQPLRKMIFDHSEQLKDVIDSYISEFQETPKKEISDKDIVAIKLLKKIYNSFTKGKQKNYFSFDMVAKYNEYKMFVCPEDAIGQYGIGAIEGMACGCALVGLNSGVYEDLGMRDGVHYISYDGTIEDLQQKIQYYQMSEHQEKLERIAKMGCEHVREYFSHEVVAREYYRSLCEVASIHN